MKGGYKVVFDSNLETTVVDMYINKRMSGDKIASQLNINRYYIYQIIKNKGIARSNSEKSKKYFCNSNYFDVIDNEHKAYWLGFIAADGYIKSKSKYNNLALGICLSQKDKGHIEKFKNDIEATNPVLDFKENQFGTVNSRIVIVDEHLCQSLIQLGIVEHKSLILTFPTSEQLPKHLVRHFVRGYFDGDGSIKKNGDNDFGVSILGTYEFLSAIKDVYGIENVLRLNKNCSTNSYNLTFGGNKKSYKFLHQLYNDADIYLDRKYQRYQILKKLNNQ